MFNQTNFPKTIALQNFLESQIEAQTTAIEKFKFELDTGAEDALVWSEKVFSKVAAASVAKHWLEGLKNWKLAFDADSLSVAQPHTDREVMAYVINGLQREVINRAERLNQSSAVTNNLVEDHKTVATATLLRYIQNDML